MDLHDTGPGFTSQNGRYTFNRTPHRMPPRLSSKFFILITCLTSIEYIII